MKQEHIQQKKHKNNTPTQRQEIAITGSTPMHKTHKKIKTILCHDTSSKIAKKLAKVKDIKKVNVMDDEKLKPILIDEEKHKILKEIFSI